MVKARREFCGGAIVIQLALVSCVGVVCTGTAGLAASGWQGEDLSVAAEATRRFEEQMRLAEITRGRDAKIEHLRKALEQRPGHLDNLAAEFRIAVLLSQYWDPNHPQPLRPEEATAVYRHILQTYHHMDHYAKEPVNSSSDMQFTIPEAALHLASHLSDPNKAREWIHFAMECIAQTYARRVADWTNAPAPPEVREDDPFGGPIGRAKWEGRIRWWQQCRERAAAGDVFSPLEMVVVETAVRQYRYSFGRLRPTDVAIPMGRIVRDFPDTPMARIAQQRIDRIRRLFPELDLEKLLDSSVPESPDP